MAGAPAHDAAQHVAPSFIARKNTVADEKSDGPRVIGDHPHGNVILFIITVTLPGKLLHMADDPLEEVCIVVGGYPLHDRGNPLQPHAGIHRRFGQRQQISLGITVELHEDIVPDLHVTVTVAPHFTGRAATAGSRTIVPENLRARAAGTGITH